MALFEEAAWKVAVPRVAAPACAVKTVAPIVIVSAVPETKLAKEEIVTVPYGNVALKGTSKPLRMIAVFLCQIVDIVGE